MKRKIKTTFYSEAKLQSKQSWKEVKNKEMSLDKTIRGMREKLELSGADLCRKAGDLDPKTLTAVEKGRIKNPSLKTLESIARGMNVAVSDLFREAEVEVDHNLLVGSQKGYFILHFPKEGAKLISFTPFVRDFFCGKLILSPKKKIDSMLLQHKAPVFLSVLIGKAEIAVGKKKFTLKEGENIYFNGSLEHSISNPLHKDTTLQLVTAPSFL